METAAYAERSSGYGSMNKTDESVDLPEDYGNPKSEYTPSEASDYGNAFVAYAEHAPKGIYGDQTSEKTSLYSSDYESTTIASYETDNEKARVGYAEQELYNVYNECGEYEDLSKDGQVNFSGSIDENIYAYIGEYEEIDTENDLDQIYITIDDNDRNDQVIQQRPPVSCFAAILNPHQLLFGWKSKVPWACQTTLRTWSRVLSTRMNVQFSVASSGNTATITFLRRTVKDYNRRAPNTIQNHETLPRDFLENIQTVFDMAKHKPTRFKNIIGISCFPINMSMPKSLWKDLAVLSAITASKNEKSKKNGSSVVLVSTDAAADRSEQLKIVVRDFYSKRYDLDEKSLKTFIMDTGPGFRNMHSSVFAMKALSCLAQRGQSILLPEPCHPTLTVWFNVFQYTTGVTPRFYRRDPKRSWMLDFAGLKEKIDETTAAVFMSNPSVMCGGISSLRELDIFTSMLAERKIPLIVEESMDYLVYDQQQPAHSVLELKPPVPVIVINSCYRWMIFGAQGPTIAWSLVYDPESLLPNSLYESLQAVQAQSIKMSTGLPSPSSLSAVLHYDGWTNDIVRYMAKNMAIAAGVLSKTPGLFVSPPKAGYFLVIMIDLLDGFGGKFENDTEFTTALFNEESVKVVCGSVLLGWKNSFALEMYMRRDLLIEACDRIDEFCRRHAVKRKWSE